MGKTIKISLGVFFAGIIIGALGILLIGYLSAIAIPEYVFAQFDSSVVPFVIIGVMSQFLAFGVFGILLMIMLSRISEAWLLNSLVCYTGFLVYVGVLEPLIQGHEIYNPLAGISYSYNYLPFAVLPLSLLVSSYLIARVNLKRDAKIGVN